MIGGQIMKPILPVIGVSFLMLSLTSCMPALKVDYGSVKHTIVVGGNGKHYLFQISENETDIGLENYAKSVAVNVGEEEKEADAVSTCRGFKLPPTFPRDDSSSGWC